MHPKDKNALLKYIDAAIDDARMKLHGADASERKGFRAIHEGLVMAKGLMSKAATQEDCECTNGRGVVGCCLDLDCVGEICPCANADIVKLAVEGYGKALNEGRADEWRERFLGE